MKNKFFLLSTIISSCILTIACNQSTADEMNVPPGGKRSCYPASKCNGDPNLIGGGNQGYGGGGYGYSGQQQSYNNGGPKTLQTESSETFEGKVKSVNRVQLPNQTQIQIVVATDRGDILVILGPSSFVDQAKVKMQAGDKITVKGFRIQANGTPVIMAAEIKKNGFTLQLLDDKRNPMWEQGVGQDRGYGQQGYSQSGGYGPSYGQGYDQGGYGPGQGYSNMPYSGSQHPYMPNSRY